MERRRLHLAALPTPQRVAGDGEHDVGQGALALAFPYKPDNAAPMGGWAWQPLRTTESGSSGRQPTEPEHGATTPRWARHGKRLAKVMALPFEASATRRVLCSQGNHARAGTHKGLLRFAFDFAMPVGTPVLAAEGGTVVCVQDEFEEGGQNQAFRARANHVILKHDDNTYSRYFHLDHKGSKVKVGDRVQVGDVIALSGNTGFTNGPHLHFDLVDLLAEHTACVSILSPPSPLHSTQPAPLPVAAIAATFSAPLPATPLELLVVAGEPVDGSAPLANAADVRGQACFLERRGELFSDMLARAVNAGARCLVVGNDADEGMFAMGGVKQPAEIPVVMVPKQTGLLLTSQRGCVVFVQAGEQPPVDRSGKGRNGHSTPLLYVGDTVPVCFSFPGDARRTFVPRGFRLTPPPKFGSWSWWAECGLC